MYKIPTLFVRDDKFKLTPVLKPECAWVAEGAPVVRVTEKVDGTNIRLTVRHGQIVRVEKRRNPSKEHQAHGIKDGWYVDTSPASPEDKHILAAVDTIAQWMGVMDIPDGEHCAEACGPNIQGNPLKLGQPSVYFFDRPDHQRMYHDVPRDLPGLRDYLENLYSEIGTEMVGSVYPASRPHAEGLVFHHVDGRRAKIKRRDFGFCR